MQTTNNTTRAYPSGKNKSEAPLTAKTMPTSSCLGLFAWLLPTLTLGDLSRQFQTAAEESASTAYSRLVHS